MRQISKLEQNGRFKYNHINNFIKYKWSQLYNKR